MGKCKERRVDFESDTTAQATTRNFHIKFPQSGPEILDRVRCVHAICLICPDALKKCLPINISVSQHQLLLKVSGLLVVTIKDVVIWLKSVRVSRF